MEESDVKPELQAPQGSQIEASGAGDLEPPRSTLPVG